MAVFKKVDVKSSAAVRAIATPSGRTHGPPPGMNVAKRDWALPVEVASSALKVPLNFAPAASLWHSESAAARPEGVQVLLVTNAMRPLTGLTVTGTLLSTPKQ